MSQKEFHAYTARLSAGSVDEDLTKLLNHFASQGWLLHTVGEAIQTRVAGGALTVDRLLVFVRDQGARHLLVEEPDTAMSAT